MTWHIFKNGRSIGQTGSEGGIILRDEEHVDGSCVTLERGGPTAPFAITCGISGWMLHTRFFGTETEAQSEYVAMKDALSEILAGIPMATDLEVDAKCSSTSRSIEEFVKTGIDSTSKSHSNFKRAVNWSHESGFRYVFHGRDDKNRELTLTVLVFHVPK